MCQSSKFDKSDKCPFEHTVSIKQCRVTTCLSTDEGSKDRQLLTASFNTLLDAAEDIGLNVSAAAKNL